MIKPRQNMGGSSHGPSIDISGTPVVDPTDNVIAMIHASNLRQDDLRQAFHEFSKVESSHLHEMANLRAEEARLLRTSDLDRHEKTRQVDVLAAAASAAALATAVSALAATSDRNADNLRNQVNANATTLAKQVSDAATATATQTDSLVKDINNRIAELQKSSYQGAGRQSVVDPQMVDFMNDMKFMLKSQAAVPARREGAAAMWGYVAAGFGFVLTLVGIGGALIALLRSTPT